MDKPYQTQSSRLLPTIIVFVLVIGILYTSFLFFKGRSLKSELARIEDEQIETQNAIDDLKEDQIEEFLIAQELQEKIVASSIKWSQLIKRLNDLAPVAVFYRTYAGSDDGTVEISGLAENYVSVSDTIKALENSGNFDQVFVPSVSLGKTSDGREIVSFTLQVHKIAE